MENKALEIAERICARDDYGSDEPSEDKLLAYAVVKLNDELRSLTEENCRLLSQFKLAMVELAQQSQALKEAYDLIARQGPTGARKWMKKWGDIANSKQGTK